MSMEMIDRLTAQQKREDDGVLEEVGTLDHEGRRLFFLLARPSRAARSSGIVICHSYFELSMLQEAEIAFARRAAGVGFACLYVQAPGMGDSEGVPAECSIADRVGSVIAASEELRRRVPDVSKILFFGARLGGLVAARAAGRVAGGGVLAWDPNFEPSIYWKQVRRLARVAAVAGEQRFFEDPQVELDRDGAASVLGVEVTSTQLDDLTASGLEDVEAIGGPVFVVSLDDAGARAAQAALGPKARALVETLSIGQRDIWRLGLRRGRGAVEPTVEWMKERLS